MKIQVNNFYGLRPILDVREPNPGFAVECTDALLRREALWPFPKPTPTQYSVSTGSNKIMLDARTATPIGGSYKAGMATETFPDSELLYVMDPVIGSYVKDAAGVRMPVVPQQPALDSGGNPQFSISDVAQHTEATDYRPDDMSRFSINLNEAEAAPSSDTSRAQGALTTTAMWLNQAYSASTPWLQWPGGDYYQALKSLQWKMGLDPHADPSILSAINYTSPMTMPAWTSAVPWVDMVSLTELVRWVFVFAKAYPYLLKRESSGHFIPADNGHVEGLTLWSYIQSLVYAPLFSTTGRTDNPYPPIFGSVVSSTQTPPAANSSQDIVANAEFLATIQVGSAVADYVMYLMADPTNVRLEPTTTEGAKYLFGPVENMVNSAFANCLIHTESPIGYSRPAFPVMLLQATIDHVVADLFNIVNANFNTGAATVDLWPVLEDSLNYWFNAVSEAFRSQTSGVTIFNQGQIVPFPDGTHIPDMTDAYDMPVPRAYCYTWYDKYGRESAPSYPVTKITNTNYGYAPDHAITLTEPIPTFAEGAHIYRAVSSPMAADPSKMDSHWLRCMSIDRSKTFVDVPLPPYDEQIGLELETHEYVPVPADASFTRETHGGYLVWATQNDTVVQMSLRHIWYGTHPTRTIQLPRAWKVMGIEVYGDDFYIITDHKPLFVQPKEDKGVDGLRLDVATLYHAPSGCVNAASVCSTQWGVAYFSPVGMVLLHGNNVALPISGMFDTQDMLDIAPTTCSAYWDGRYFGFRDQSCVVIDMPDPLVATGRKPSVSKLSFGASAAFADPYGYLYILPTGSDVVHQVYLNSQDVMTYSYTTTEIPERTLNVYTAFYVSGTGVDVDCELKIDGRTVMHRRVPINKMVRIPRYHAGYKVQVRLVGTAHVNEVTLSTTGIENITADGGNKVEAPQK